MTAAELIAFEREVADRFERGEIRSPVHLSGGNEDALIAIFKEVRREDWVFSTWRSHYHALLHGIPPEKVMAQIMSGRSMNLAFPEHRFLTSAIVGGILPLACGVAYAGERVWCFVGDMTASIGAFRDGQLFAAWHHLDMHWVVEDNGLSTNTPTHDAWGRSDFRGLSIMEKSYKYQRLYPHVGSGVYVQF